MPRDNVFSVRSNTLHGTLSGNQNLIGRYALAKERDPEPYDGAYRVTPRMREQVLETEGKLMADDVTVEIIPVTYTTNVHGGKTVVIG